MLIKLNFIPEVVLPLVRGLALVTLEGPLPSVDPTVLNHVSLLLELYLASLKATNVMTFDLDLFDLTRSIFGDDVVFDLVDVGLVREEVLGRGEGLYAV